MRNWKTKPKSKFGNIKVGKYDSKKESNRAKQLRILQWKGEIKDLQEQVPFELIPSQYREVDGKRRCIERNCKYIADFVYTDTTTGQQVVEDTKGVRTPEYKIKRKLMLWLHGVQIKET